MLTFVYFIVILGVIITIHEIGHLIAAKFFGVYCHEFAIGFGPKIFSKKTKETTYSLRLLPLGGFVSMAGEGNVDTTDIPITRTLKGINPFKRIVVMASGIVLNLVLGFILFILLFTFLGQRVEPPQPIIETVFVNGPAENAGILAGDRVREVILYDGSQLIPDNGIQMLQFLSGNTREVTFVLDRAGSRVVISLTPEYNVEQGRYMIGISIPQGEVVQMNLLESVQHGIAQGLFAMSAVFMAIIRLIQGTGFGDLAGPIGILSVTNDMVTQAPTATDLIANLLNLTAFLSINVAVFNLLPLPIFDGGRILITIVEIIINRPVNKKLEEALMMISLALILLLFAFVMWQDITRLF